MANFQADVRVCTTSMASTSMLISHWRREGRCWDEMVCIQDYTGVQERLLLALTAAVLRTDELKKAKAI